MPKHLRVSIPEPCHENWNHMSPTDKGRHCNSCDKVVVDFSTMSDTQIVDYFKAVNTKTCGRFRSDQLNRDISFTASTVRSARIKYIAVSMFVANLFAYRAHAKTDVTIEEPVVQIDSCVSAEADSALAMEVDSCAYVWEVDTAKVDTTITKKKPEFEVIYSVVSGNIAIRMGDYAPTLGLVSSPHCLPEVLVEQTTRGLKFFSVDLSFWGFKNLTKGNKPATSLVAKDTAALPIKPKPGKRRQLLNWLSTLPKRIGIGQEEASL